MLLSKCLYFSLSPCLFGVISWSPFISLFLSCNVLSFTFSVIFLCKRYLIFDIYRFWNILNKTLTWQLRPIIKPLWSAPALQSLLTLKSLSPHLVIQHDLTRVTDLSILWLIPLGYTLWNIPIAPNRDQISNYLTELTLFAQYPMTMALVQFL